MVVGKILLLKLKNKLKDVNSELIKISKAINKIWKKSTNFLFIFHHKPIRIFPNLVRRR